MANDRSTPHQKPNLPWVRWFPRDFTAATQGWPAEAVGAYIRLLNAQWDLDGLPADERTLQQIAGLTAVQWRKAWPLIQPKFPVRGIQRRNPRLELERIRAAKSLDKRVVASRIANRVRWGRVVSIRSESESEPESESHYESESESVSQQEQEQEKNSSEGEKGGSDA